MDGCESDLPTSPRLRERDERRRIFFVRRKCVYRGRALSLSVARFERCFGTKFWPKFHQISPALKYRVYYVFPIPSAFLRMHSQRVAFRRFTNIRHRSTIKKEESRHVAHYQHCYFLIYHVYEMLVLGSP